MDQITIELRKLACKMARAQFEETKKLPNGAAEAFSAETGYALSTSWGILSGSIKPSLRLLRALRKRYPSAFVPVHSNLAPIGTTDKKQTTLASVDGCSPPMDNSVGNTAKVAE